MNDLFIPILDDDEVVQKTYRPNKCKLFFSSIFSVCCTLLLFCGGLAFTMFMPDEETGKVANAIYCLVPIGIFVLGILVATLFTSIYYKKTAYAVTNKRIVIRTGIIGVDFKSLDMGMIGAIDVYVGLTDKILHKNTGTIRFGSTSSPINSDNVNKYVFKGIVDPYKNCKEIKASIDAYKKATKQAVLENGIN